MISLRIIQRLLLVGMLLAAGLILAILVFRYPTRDVPVLRIDVPPGTVIEPRMLGTLSWPENAVYNGMVVEDRDIVGKVASVPIARGVPISLGMFGTVDTDTDGRYPAATEADRYRLKVFFPAGGLDGSSGNTIVAGGYVNIFWRDTEARRAELILQKVRVVGARTEAGLSQRLDLSTVTTGAGAAASKGGGKTLPAGYLLSLDLDQARFLLGYESRTLLLVPVEPCAPQQSGVPSGVPIEELNCALAGTDTLATPSPTPPPVIVTVGSTPAPGPSFGTVVIAPSPAASPAASPASTIPVSVPGASAVPMATPAAATPTAPATAAPMATPAVPATAVPATAATPAVPATAVPTRPATTPSATVVTVPVETLAP